MEASLSYCGLICTGCPLYMATIESDTTRKKRMKEKIAKMSNEMYKTNFTAKDITDCDGCMVEDGRLFPGCYDCGIRNCAREKNIPNCAWCEEYSCDKLTEFFKENPESKVRLEFIRSVV
jgi:hypothetical protein